MSFQETVYETLDTLTKDKEGQKALKDGDFLEGILDFIYDYWSTKDVIEKLFEDNEFKHAIFDYLFDKVS